MKIFKKRKETLIWNGDPYEQDVRGKELSTLFKLIEKHGTKNLALMYDDRGIGLYLFEHDK